MGGIVKQGAQRPAIINSLPKALKERNQQVENDCKHLSLLNA